MKIISIKQPWASLIVSGAKDIENRTWPTKYRGPVLVHASQRADEISSEDIERRFGVRTPGELPLGGVIGMTEIVDCVRPPFAFSLKLVATNGQLAGFVVLRLCWSPYSEERR